MNGPGMQAFLEAYQRTSAMLDQRDRQRGQDTLTQQDRQRTIERQDASDRMAAETHAARMAQQGQTDALQRLQIPGQLAELGGTAETPDDAQRLIETVLPSLMQSFGQETMAFGQPAVEMAQRTITARQKRQVSEFVERALKTSFVADNPDADPVIESLPEHVATALGKSAAKLSELQQFAQLPVGRLASPRSANPTSASLALDAAGGDPGQALKLLHPDKPEKPAKVGYRWLVRSDGTPFEWPDDQPSPRGSKPYDVVAARQAGAGAGGPSAYSVERAHRTIQSVDQLTKKVSRWTTGLGSVLASIPETDARNFKAELDTLKASIAFNELTAMREASKTGGALGNVSDREINLLQSALGALDAGQSPENIKSQLEQIKASVQRWQMAHSPTPAVSHGPAPRSSGGARVGDIVKNRQTGELAEVTAIRPDGSLVLKPRP